MKKELILIILAIMAIGYVSCEKPKEKDYREKWVGTYECEEKYSWWLMSEESGEEIFQTTVNITAIGDSTLKILENRTEKNYETKVSNTGDFIEHYPPSFVKPLIVGNFYIDSLNMTIYHSTALGYSSTSCYICKKLKDKKQ